MGFIVGVMLLPFLLWSWLFGKNEDDGELTISLLSWMVIGGIALGVGAWAIGLGPFG